MNISLNFVPKVPINNIPALAQIMARHQWGTKPLSEPVMVSLLTHTCITWAQWVEDNHEWPWEASNTRFYNKTFNGSIYEQRVSTHLGQVYIGSMKTALISPVTHLCERNAFFFFYMGSSTDRKKNNPIQDYLNAISVLCNLFVIKGTNKQRVLMHRHQRWNVRHGLCHIYMRYLYIYMSCL